MISPRRSGPGDLANFIALAIFPEAIELASLAALPAPAFLQFHLTAADQIEAVLFRFIEIREYGYYLRRVRDGPAFSNAQRALIADKYAAQLRVAALGRKYWILPTRRRSCAHLQF